MRSHEERVAETKRRIAKIEREKRLRRDKFTMMEGRNVLTCAPLNGRASNRYRPSISAPLHIRWKNVG